MKYRIIRKRKHNIFIFYIQYKSLFFWRTAIKKQFKLTLNIEDKMYLNSFEEAKLYIPVLKEYFNQTTKEIIIYEAYNK